MMVLAPMRLIKAVLPHMIAQRSGSMCDIGVRSQQPRPPLQLEQARLDLKG
jgi:hypothetical protein